MQSFPRTLLDEGYRTALISPFPQRHGAFHVLDGFDEWEDTGGGGSERADVVAPYAEEWLEEHAEEENWYLHVNLWDPHTPYDTPMEYGNPFEDEPAPDFPDAETIEKQYESYGPHSAQEVHAWGEPREDLERTPPEIADREDFEEWIDGYDVGVRYMDDHLGELFDLLREKGLYEDTLIVISADHGENQGELNVYGDHQTADDKTCRIPLSVRGPGVESGVDEGFHYNIDMAATLVDFADLDVPDRWDGESFIASLTDGEEAGREHLVVSQGAWACQRAVRWDEYILIRTYHDGLKDFDPVELYDLDADPHETENLAHKQPDITREGILILEDWVSARLRESATDSEGGNPDPAYGLEDPLWRVIEEGGPYHAGPEQREMYVERLRETDREEHAKKLEEKRGLVTQSARDYLQNGRRQDWTG